MQNQERNGRQADAILRLRRLLAEERAAAAADMAIEAEAIGPPPPARAHAAPTLDQVRPLLRSALKIPRPRNERPTIGGDLDRSTVYRRRQSCGPMTDVWMENCGFATNETEPARIVAASLDPKVLKAAGRLVAVRRVRSVTSIRREHLRIMRGFIGEKKLDPRFSQKQAVERAMSGISARNMADMRRMNRNALGPDLDKFRV